VHWICEKDSESRPILYRTAYRAAVSIWDRGLDRWADIKYQIHIIYIKFIIPGKQSAFGASIDLTNIKHGFLPAKSVSFTGIWIGRQSLFSSPTVKQPSSPQSTSFMSGRISPLPEEHNELNCWTSSLNITDCGGSGSLYSSLSISDVYTPEWEVLRLSASIHSAFYRYANWTVIYYVCPCVYWCVQHRHMLNWRNID